MTEAARLVDELTTLLYEVRTGWDDSAGGHQIVRCGACRHKADRAESVVHDSDCPVYRLIRAEAANTVVIRANAEEIADLEDVRDALEAKVNALTVEVERLTRERDRAYESGLGYARAVRQILDMAYRRAHKQIIDYARAVLGGVADDPAEAERDALAAQVAALREALAYYAEPRQYNRAGGDPADAAPFIQSDRGRRARAALAEAPEVRDE